MTALPRARVVLPILEPLESRIAPASFTVTNLFDSGAGSLRDAINQANSHIGADTIIFKTAPGTISLSSALPTITDSLTITGPGAGKLSIDGAGTNRVLDIESSNPINITLSGLTLKNGLATQGAGLQIYDRGGNVMVLKCVISGNSAIGTDATGYGNAGGDARGGGIFNSGSNLTLDETTVSGNIALGGKGSDGATGNPGLNGSPGAQGANGQGAGASGTYGGNGGAGQDGGVGGQGGQGGSAFGGGIFNSSGSTLTLDEAVISGNLAKGGQGGKGGTGGTGGNGGIGGAGGNGVDGYSSYSVGGNGGDGGTGGNGGNGGIGGQGGVGGGGGHAYGGGVHNEGTLTVVEASIVTNNTVLGGKAGVGGTGGTGGTGGHYGLGGSYGQGGSYYGETGTNGSNGTSYNGSNGTDGHQGYGGNGGQGGNGFGGGIHNTGALTIASSKLSGNFATAGNGGAPGSGFYSQNYSPSYGSSGAGKGGAISSNAQYLVNPNPTIISKNGFRIPNGNYTAGLFLQNVTVSSNQADNNGGGIFIQNGQAQIQKSTFDHNSAQNGGAIYTQSHLEVKITDSAVVNGNHAFNLGGGIFNAGSQFHLINSTVSGNSAESHGGGVFNSGESYFGPAIPQFVGYSTGISIEHSTISGNTAISGGGIYNTGTLDIVASKIKGNTAAYTNSSPGILHPNEPINNLDRGGGIFNRGYLDISASSITANTATQEGGGLYNRGESLISTTVISGNHAGRSGGGAANEYGFLSVDKSVISKNSAQESGGGIASYAGAFDIENSTVSSNTSSSTGGGIALGESHSHTGETIKNCTISGNTAGQEGGGVSAYYTNVTIIGSKITRNNSGHSGGGIASYNGSLSIVNTTISGNKSSRHGGGIYSGGGEDGAYLTLSNTIISGNSASFAGGGIDSEYTSASIFNSTISGNTAGTHGGGAYIYGGNLVMNQATIAKNLAKNGNGGGIAVIDIKSSIITNSTIALNVAKVVTNAKPSLIKTNFKSESEGGGLFSETRGLQVISTIIANNSASNGADSFGGFAAQYDLIQHGTGYIDEGFNILGKSAQLGSLGMHGGATATMVPAGSSPAVDNGANPFNNLLDQNGSIRLQGLATDIGAVEIAVRDVV